MCARSRRCPREGGGPARAPCLALLHVGSQAGGRAAPTTPGEEVVEEKKEGEEGERRGRAEQGGSSDVGLHFGRGPTSRRGPR